MEGGSARPCLVADDRTGGASYSIYAITYNTPDSFVYLIPAWCVAALWLAAGLDWLLEAVAASYHRRLEAKILPSSRHRVLSVALLVLLVAVPAISVVRFWHENDLSHDQEAREFLTRVLADAAPGAVILTSGDDPTFALWYAVYGLGRRPDVVPLNVNLYIFGWYRRALAGRHPDLPTAMDDIDRQLLDHLLTEVAAERPLYRADTLNVVLPGFVEEPAGVLVRLSRQAGQ